MTDPLLPLVQQVAATYHLPADLLRAQVQVESSGDPFAFRYEHAYFVRYLRHQPDVRGARFGPLAACSFGLLQILLETALEIGFTGVPQDLFTDRIGLTWGAIYLRKCWDTAGGTLDVYPKALARYNAGLAVQGPPFLNQAYIDKVYAMRVTP